jgi:proteasome lid subunit RPN8/RPN11
VYEYANSINLDVVGVFHSHPYSKAYPSSKDLRYMSINQVPWLILSLLDGEVKAFIYYNEEVKELDMVII